MSLILQIHQCYLFHRVPHLHCSIAEAYKAKIEQAVYFGDAMISNFSAL